MNNQRASLGFFGLVLILLLALGGLFWLNFRFLMQIPSKDNFLVYWISTRSLLVDGKSPYSQEVADRIHQQSTTGNHGESVPELRVTYPLYGSLIFLPFALINDYVLARALWCTLLEIAVVISTFASIKCLEWRTSVMVVLTSVIFSLGWYHTVIPIITGNSVVLMMLFLILSITAIRSGLDEIAGILLAFVTSLPQPLILILAFIILWSISHRRWRLMVWMFGSLIILNTGASLIVQDWILQYIRILLHGGSSSVVQSPGDIFRLNWPGLGLSMSWVWTIFFVLLILFEWVITLKNNYRGFLWTSALTLVISQWIGIPTNPDNFIVLLFPLILILAKIEEHWGKKVRWLLLTLLVFVFIMNWLPLWSKINQELLGYSNNFIFFPLPLFLLLGLYWVRWWAIQPKPILLANLSSEEEV